MKTIKFQRTEASEGGPTPQHASAPCGMSPDGRVATYAVRAVPEGRPLAEVQRRANQTVWWTDTPVFELISSRATFQPSEMRT